MDMEMQGAGAMPQMEGPQQVGPVTMELRRRFSQLSPQEMQQLDMELSRANPNLLQLIGKIFPELQGILSTLQQMPQGAGGQMPMDNNANPLSSDVSPGLMGGGNY